MNYQLEKAKIYNDFSGLKNINALGKQDKDAAIREVAKQFEALFMNIMLKSMRQANEVFESDLISSDKVKFYQDMLDKQLTVSMTQSKGLGLTEALVRQMRGLSGLDDESEGERAVNFSKVLFQHPGHDNSASQLKNISISEQLLRDNTQAQQLNDKVSIYTHYRNAKDFINDIMPDVVYVADQLGVDPKVLASQAALETGWGKSIMRNQDGSLSHNLFGIKADQRWQKDSVNVMTHEYRNGVAQKQRANFRSYSSFRESLIDYVDFIKSNPRYQTAVEYAADPTRYTKELQKAGYATDPRYADKIMKIFHGDIMKESLRRIEID